MINECLVVKNLLMNVTKTNEHSNVATFVYACPSTVVWEKFMVRNIREKKIRGKKFSCMQAIDEKFLTPNISYMHILTCSLLLRRSSTCKGWTHVLKLLYLFVVKNVRAFNFRRS